MQILDCDGAGGRIPLDIPGQDRPDFQLWLLQGKAKTEFKRNAAPSLNATELQVELTDRHPRAFLLVFEHQAGVGNFNALNTCPRQVKAVCFAIGSSVEPWLDASALWVARSSQLPTPWLFLARCRVKPSNTTSPTTSLPESRGAIRRETSACSMRTMSDVANPTALPSVAGPTLKPMYGKRKTDVAIEHQLTPCPFPDHLCKFVLVVVWVHRGQDNDNDG